MLKVNGEMIPDEAVEYEYRRLVRFYEDHMSVEQIRAQTGVLRRQARQQAVGAKLLLNRVRQLDIAVPAEEVDAKLDSLIGNAGGEKAFDAMLKRQNLSRESVEESIKDGLKVDKLVGQIVSEVPEPGEKDVRSHFEAHRGEYKRAERVLAQHILVRPASASAEAVESARTRIEEIRRRALDGEDFAELAAEYSECPSGRKTGGSLGWFGRGMMLPALDEAVFALEVGDISEVVESELGMHIVRKADHEEASDADFEDVADKVKDFLRHSYRGAALSTYLEDLKKDAVIEET